MATLLRGATATNGQPTAELITALMNWRRLIVPPRAWTRHLTGSNWEIRSGSFSDLGQKGDAGAMSALPPKADMCAATRDVRFGPKADSCTAPDNIFIRSTRLRAAGMLRQFSSRVSLRS